MAPTHPHLKWQMCYAHLHGRYLGYVCVTQPPLPSNLGGRLPPVAFSCKMSTYVGHPGQTSEMKCHPNPNPTRPRSELATVPVCTGGVMTADRTHHIICKSQTPLTLHTSQLRWAKNGPTPQSCHPNHLAPDLSPGCVRERLVWVGGVPARCHF